MGKLSILGAQRVKALTEMLNSKEKEELARVRRELPSESEVKRQVDEEFGILDKTERIDELIEEVRKLSDDVTDVTGEEIRVDFRRNTNFRSSNRAEWYKRYQEIKRENEKAILEAQRDFADRRNRLWLCETLEEAKELVGIE